MFTGTFKALPINDEYVVFINGSMTVKWKPGWDTTYPWGLNKPPNPTVSAGTSLNKTIDDFEDLADWSASGGGGSGTLAADTTNIRSSGTQSMKLTLDAESTILATKEVSLDLSKFTAAGDAGAVPYLSLSYYTDDLAAIQAIVLKLSCASDGGFNKDFYKCNLSLGGYVYATLAPTGESEGSGTYETVIRADEFPGTGPNYYKYYTKPDDTSGPKYELMPDGSFRLIEEEEEKELEIVTIQAKRRDIISSSQAWTDIKIPLAKFARIGDTSGRDWSTITAVQIEVQSSSVAAEISFDDWLMIGGGNLFGHYWVAVAYQNELGNYGPFSDFVGPLELDAQSLLISNLVPDTDLQTVKRRFVILGGSLIQPMVSYLANNTDTSVEFNELESSLTTVERFFNNLPPPDNAIDMVEMDGRIHMVKGNNQQIYSEPLMYEAFPLKNYRTLVGGEQLHQVAIYQEGYVAFRGKGREYLLQVSGSTPAFWHGMLGAPQGAVSTRMLLQDPAGPQVFMSERGFYASGPGIRGEYLVKINPVITDHDNAFGDMIHDRAYVYFKDNDRVGRVMRIDYRLGRPLAHYVTNLEPATIFADQITNSVYYAYGSNIYEFAAGENYLTAILEIPGQLCGYAKLKSFESLAYELSDNYLYLTLTMDRQALAGYYTLAVAERQETPVSLPQITGQHLKLTLTSLGNYFVMYLPWNIEWVPV